MNKMISPAAQAKIAERRQAVRRSPRDPNAHALLGLALLKELQLAEGADVLQRALELNPKLRGVHAVLADALFDLRRYEEAVACYRMALRFQEAADLHQHLADVLVHLGRADEAEPSARRAAELLPKNIDIQLTLAGVLTARGATTQASKVMATVQDLAPNDVAGRFELACLLYKRNRIAEALVYLEDVLTSDPDHVEALRHLALCQRHLDNGDEAIRALTHAVALTPENDALHEELCAVFQNFNHYPEAIKVARAILERNPVSTDALGSLLHCSFMTGEWEQALGAARKLLEVAPTATSHSMLLFILSHCCNDGLELTREHFAYGERWEPSLQALRRPHANDRDPGRVLRVGLVSGDLYNHAMANFLAPTLTVLKESTQIEIYAYYNNPTEDAVTRAIKKDVHAWRVIWNLDDPAAEDMIRKDGIDILIDLSGHSALNRLPLFARKPAPVQATWMGYAGTTGLKAMDYILCDRFMVPGSRYDAQFSENIVKLPIGAPFLPSPDSPPVNELPALSNGYLTFGSFHRASKLSPSVIALWASLLRAIPTAKMLLGGLVSGNGDLLAEWFAKEGIPRERLLMRPRIGIHAYLKQHYEVDICLSPFPYSGSTTIGHALWMGVPTLGTIGATNPSQATAPLMAHLGLHSFVTENPETYIKLGQLLSESVPALAAMRSTMRERFLNSILGYPGIVGAGVELALRRMWERWCAGLDAAPIEVTMQDLADLGAANSAQREHQQEHQRGQV